MALEKNQPASSKSSDILFVYTAGTSDPEETKAQGRGCIETIQL